MIFPWLSGCARDKKSPELEWPDDRPSNSGIMRIVLRTPDASGMLAPTSVLVEIDGKWIEVLPIARTERIREIEVPTGNSYRVRIVAAGYRTFDRTISVRSSLTAIRFYLIPESWPYYFASGIAMPVRPDPRLLAVAFGRRAAASSDVKTAIADAEKRGVTRVTTDPLSGNLLGDINQSVLYFVPTDPNDIFFSFSSGPNLGRGRATAAPIVMLKKIFSKWVPRMGSPVSANPGKVRILDNQYLIRFASANVRQTQVEEFAKSIDARLLHRLDPGSEYWLIEFEIDPQNLGRHLETIAREVSGGALASGEPNLLFELQTHAPPMAGTTTESGVQGSSCEVVPGVDPYFGCQENLDTQRVKKAWSYIEQHVPGKGYGSADVRVATIDKGIAFDALTNSSVHPDVRSERLGYCYDLTIDGPCTQDEAASNFKLHGMASYGIISATPGNGFGITGIAPNSTHIAIQQLSLAQSPDQYAQTLLWVGGIRDEPPDSAPGATKPIPPADIISCSHGLAGHPFPEAVDEALTRLAADGRNGLGTILIYSAGNENSYVEDDKELATHPDTIGVGNTNFKDGVEVRHEASSDIGSNFGPWIDICANGSSAPSLQEDPEGQGPPCECGDPLKGVFPHGGTSAAASMVSAAAALVLTINPGLSARQVRSILCATAKKIDCGNETMSLENAGLTSSGRWHVRETKASAPVPCASLPLGLEWFSEWYGYGRLDVYEAVKRARKTDPAS